MPSQVSSSTHSQKSHPLHLSRLWSLIGGLTSVARNPGSIQTGLLCARYRELRERRRSHGTGRPFGVFRGVHKVWNSCLQLHTDVWDPVGEYAVGILKEAVAEETAKGGFDEFLSEPFLTYYPRSSRLWGTSSTGRLSSIGLSIVDEFQLKPRSGNQSGSTLPYRLLGEFFARQDRIWESVSGSLYPTRFEGHSQEHAPVAQDFIPPDLSTGTTFLQ